MAGQLHCALLAILLLDVVIGATFTEVETAQALQDAVAQGTTHIIVTKHLNFTGLQPQGTRNGCRFAVALDATELRGGSAEVRSITGRCGDPPAFADTQAPGQCAIFLGGLSGFWNSEYNSEHYYHNLHFVMSETSRDDPQEKLCGIYTEAPKLYMSNVTIESATDQYAPDVPEAQALGLISSKLIASGLSILNVRSRASPVNVAYAAASLADLTVRNNVLNATRTCADETQSCESLIYAGPEASLRLQRCSFAENAALLSTSQRIFDLDFNSDSSFVYSDDADLSVLSGSPLGALAVADSTGRFLTFQDASLQTLQNEIDGYVAASTAPTPAAEFPTKAESPATAGSNSGTPTAAPGLPDPDATGSSNTLTIAVVATVLVLGVAVAAVVGWYLLRRRRRRMRGADPKIAQTQPASTSQSGEGRDTDRTGPTRSSDYGSMAPPESSKKGADAELVTMTMWSGGETTIVPQAAKASQRNSALVTMTEWTDSDAEASICMVAPSQPGPQPGLQAQRSAIAKTPHVQTRRERRALSVDALVDALDDMHFKRQHLMSRWVVLDATQRRVGGQGVVQFMTDRESGVEVAVKFFADQHTFLREAQLYGQKLIREMMAAVVDMQDNAGGEVVAPDGTALPAFIILEKGRSLDEWALITAPDFPTSLQVLLQIVDRLKALHACGLVHRDIKPANILWRSDAASWTLIDFGCAAAQGCPAGIACSIRYSPPEVAQAIKEKRSVMKIDSSLDIWAIGVVTYELLVGVKVFAGCDEDGIIDALTGEALLPWEKGSVHEARMQKLGMVRKVVKKCLSRDPAARPTAENLFASLNNVFYGRSTG